MRAAPRARSTPTSGWRPCRRATPRASSSAHVRDRRAQGRGPDRRRAGRSASERAERRVAEARVMVDPSCRRRRPRRWTLETIARRAGLTISGIEPRTGRGLLGADRAGARSRRARDVAARSLTLTSRGISRRSGARPRRRPIADSREGESAHEPPRPRTARSGAGPVPRRPAARALRAIRELRPAGGCPKCRSVKSSVVRTPTR